MRGLFREQQKASVTRREWWADDGGEPVGAEVCFGLQFHRLPCGAHAAG